MVRFRFLISGFWRLAPKVGPALPPRSASRFQGRDRRDAGYHSRSQVGH